MELRVSSSWHSGRGEPSSSQTCPCHGGQAASTPGSQGAPRLGSEGVGCRAPVQSLCECGTAPEGTQRHLLCAPNSRGRDPSRTSSSQVLAPSFPFLPGCSRRRCLFLSVHTVFPRSSQWSLSVHARPHACGLNALHTRATHSCPRAHRVHTHSCLHTQARQCTSSHTTTHTLTPMHTRIAALTSRFSPFGMVSGSSTAQPRVKAPTRPIP